MGARALTWLFFAFTSPLPSRPLPRGLGAAPSVHRPVPPPPSPGVPEWQVRKAGELGAGRAPRSLRRSGGAEAEQAEAARQVKCAAGPCPGSLRQGQGRGRGRFSALGEASSSFSTLALCLTHRLPPSQPSPRPPWPARPAGSCASAARASWEHGRAHKPGEARLPRPAHPPEQASSSRAAEGDHPGSRGTLGAATGGAAPCQTVLPPPTREQWAAR